MHGYVPKNAHYRCHFVRRAAGVIGLCGLILAVATSSGLAAMAPAESIGMAASIKNKVTGKRLEEIRALAKGDGVFQNETIETGKQAQAEFILKDGTKLAVGPKSQLRLDKFIYDPEKKTGEIILNAAAGSFRFITGLADKTAYRIKTPVATIGVRGTIFDGYVNDKGEIAVLLIEGEVEVCTQKCRAVKQKGRFVRVLRNGVFKGPHLWDAGFFNGIGLAKAFPFVGKKLLIDPIRHFKPGRLLRKASLVPRKLIRRTAKARRQLGRTTRKGVRGAGRNIRNFGRKTGRALRRFKPFK